MAPKGTKVTTRTGSRPRTTDPYTRGGIDPLADQFVDDPTLEDFGPAPRRVPVGEALMRHPIIALLPIVLCVGLAIAGAMARSPNYTSDARMRVSALNLGAPGALAGLSTASASLASSYALSVDADNVIQPAAKALHLSPQTVRQAVSGTPVPDSPVFVVTAKSDGSERSRLIANTVAQSLVDYVTRQTARADPQQLLRDYEAQSRRVNDAQVKVTEAEGKFNDNPSTKNGRKLASARSELQTAELQRGSLQTAYRAASTNSSPAPRVQILRKAAVATSDKQSKLQIFLFAGLLIGAVMGAALATLRANRRRRPAHAA
jgi:capsular polysaccharide biosynthesis protein